MNIFKKPLINGPTLGLSGVGRILCALCKQTKNSHASPERKKTAVLFLPFCVSTNTPPSNTEVEFCTKKKKRKLYKMKPSLSCIITKKTTRRFKKKTGILLISPFCYINPQKGPAYFPRLPSENRNSPPFFFSPFPPPFNLLGVTLALHVVQEI